MPAIHKAFQGMLKESEGEKMKTVEKLVQKFMNNTQIGNHAVRINLLDDSTFRDFYYYETIICRAYDWDLTFVTSNGGYNTYSTNRAINSYIHELIERGYTHTGSVDFIS